MEPDRRGSGICSTACKQRDSWPSLSFLICKMGTVPLATQHWERIEKRAGGKTPFVVLFLVHSWLALVQGMLWAGL